VEGAAFLVGGQRLGQDGRDDVARAGQGRRPAGLPEPRRGPCREPGRQLLHGGEQQFFLGAEVVLHQPQ
jgi:hypothetical protein